MLFWSLIIAMLIAALLPLLSSLLRQNPRTRAGQSMQGRDRNIELYRERLKELNQERDALDADQYTLRKLELEHTLLDDIPDSTPAEAVLPTQPAWRTVLLLVLLLPATAITLYAQLGEPPQQHPPSPTKTAQNTRMHSVDNMVAQLANRLQQQPNDPQGWMMLGRSYVTLGRTAEAALAFARAYEQVGDQAPLLADFAEALALANNDNMAGQPEEMAIRALELEPTHQKALWLAGVAAQQNNDTASARQHWRKLLAQLPPDSAEAQTLGGYLAQMGDSELSQVRQHQSAVSSANAETTAADATFIVVSVQLAPEFTAPPDAPIFIFARAVDGPRMPLAVVQSRVSDLPATFKLDDSSAMIPKMALSKFPEVVVGARISLSGSANVSSGDLQGISSSLRPAANRHVQLTIDTRVP